MQYLFNVIAVGCILILPGFTTAHVFFREELSRWVLPFRIVSYIIISLSIIFLFAFLLSKILLSLFIKRIIASSLFFIPGFFLLMQYLRQHRKINKKQSEQTPRILFCGTILLLLVWISCIPIQLYPGKNSHGMGDIPEYYLLSKNIYLGRGFITDCFIGDFFSEPRLTLQDVISSPPVSARRPLVPYVASYFFYLGGQNHYIINIIASLLASLLPLSVYSFFYYYPLHKYGTVSYARNISLQFFAILICLIPSHFVLFSLGTITIFEMFPFFMLILLIKLEDWKSPFSIFIMALSAGLISISRPEGIIIVLIVFLIYFLPPTLSAIFYKRIPKQILATIMIIVGLLIMNIPLLFIKYDSASQVGAWYNTLQYRAQTRNFQSIYYPRWPEFNYAIARNNFSDNPNNTYLLNMGIRSDIYSHPIAFGKWIFMNANKKIGAFTSLYWKEMLNYFPIVQILSVIMMLIILLGPAWEVAIFLYLFSSAFSLLSPILYPRQAIVLSPLIVVAFFATFSYKFTKIKLKNNILNYYRKMVSKLKMNPSFQRITFGLVVMCILSIIAFNNSKVIDIITNNENTKYEISIEMIKKYTELSNVIICDAPQLINLMTGRVSLGASNLLDILNSTLDRYQPDYILINDCRSTRSYTRFITGRHPLAYNYVTKNCILVAHDPQKHTLLFKVR